jgi:hypothetical protein
VNANAIVNLYEQAYDEAYAEVSRTTDPGSEDFDALLLAAYERILQEELIEP